MKTFNFVAVCAAAALALAGCNHDAPKTDAAETSASGETAAAVDGDIVATVNGTPIPSRRLEVYSPPGQNVNTAEVVENMITSELIYQAARAAKMHERPDVAEQLAVAEQTVLGRAYTQDFLANHSVSEEDVQARYAELQADLSGGNEYRSAHILVDDEALANDLHSQIVADGDKFAELAKEHSKDTGSATQGGDLGWLEPRVLVPEFASAMEAAEVGSLTAPVQTQYGWHIIRVDEKRPLSAPALNDELRARIEQAARAELFSKRIAELRDKADIVRN